MGEGARSVESDNPPQLEREIEDLREEMTAIVDEIDRRREELFDWRLQLRRHGVGPAAAAAGVVVAVGVLFGIAVWHRRRTAARADPDHLTAADLAAYASPSLTRMVVAAALSSAAGAVAKRLVRDLV